MNIEINLMQALPEIILAAAGILALVIGQFMKNGSGNFIKILSLAGLFIALAVVVNMTADANGAFVVDTFSIFFKILFISASIIVVLGSFSTIKTIHESEYYSLILFITLGMCVVASARELIYRHFRIEEGNRNEVFITSKFEEVRR